MIYFIRDPAFCTVKIGYSADPAKRFNKLRADAAAEVELVAVIDGEVSDEAALHIRFAKHSCRGEWFYERDELRDYIASLQPYERIEKRLGRSRTFSPTALSAWLDRNDWTDTKLAAAVGVSRPMLSHMRRGSRQPSIKVAAALTRVTGLPLDAFVTGAA